MIMLYVRSVKTDTTNENEYDWAVYWLLNEETNQTLDESNIKRAFENEIPDVRIEDADGDEEPPQQVLEEEEEEGVERPEKLLLCGWMYKSGGNWIYEWFNFSFYEHKQPHLSELLGKIEVESWDYVNKNKERIQ